MRVQDERTSREHGPGDASQLGPYRLIERIGEGGMGAVWRGERVAEGGFRKRVAIKRMLPRYRADRGLVQRFLTEARTTARLEHPNIVQVIDFAADPEPYLVLEYVEGVSLAGLLTRLVQAKDRLGPVTAAYVAAEAATGLDYAHRRCDETGQPLGIIHRDVSPQNVLLSRDGAVKVSDFGIAKAADNSYRTQTGVTVGKAGYMAPEQVQGLEIDARVDVFAMGIVLWEMLTMRPLLPRDDPGKAISMLLAGDFALPSQVAPGVPPELDAIVAGALRIDREHRTPSTGALSSALRAWVHESAPGYGENDLAALLARTFPERSWIVEAPQSPPARPRTSFDGSAIDGRARAVSARASGTSPLVPVTRPTRSSSPTLLFVLLGGLVLLVLLAAVAVGAWLYASREPAPPTAPAAPSQTAGATTAAVSPTCRIATTPVQATVVIAGQPRGTTPMEIGPTVTVAGPMLLLAPMYEPRTVTPMEISTALSSPRRALEIQLAPVHPGEMLGVAYVNGGDQRERVRAPRTAELVPLPAYVAFPMTAMGTASVPSLDVVGADGTIVGQLSLQPCGLWSVCSIGPVVFPAASLQPNPP